MKTTTIKWEEMTTAESSNKQLMFSSAMWLNVLLLLVLFLTEAVGLTVSCPKVFYLAVIGMALIVMWKTKNKGKGIESEM